MAKVSLFSSTHLLSLHAGIHTPVMSLAAGSDGMDYIQHTAENFYIKVLKKHDGLCMMVY